MHEKARRATDMNKEPRVSQVRLIPKSSLRYAGWDAKVKELCEKDGGVTVYEPVKLTESEYHELRSAQGGAIAPKASAKPNGPYVSETKTVWLHEGDPGVFRSESVIVRTSDKKVLSRLVYYGRTREGVIAGYDCGNAGVRIDLTRQTFRVVEDQGQAK